MSQLNPYEPSRTPVEVASREPSLRRFWLCLPAVLLPPIVAPTALFSADAWWHLRWPNYEIVSVFIFIAGVAGAVGIPYLLLAWAYHRHWRALRGAHYFALVLMILWMPAASMVCVILSGLLADRLNGSYLQ